MPDSLPKNYVKFSAVQQTKRILLVAKFDGIETLFSSAAVYSVARYGDPGLFYGTPGLVYGGLRKRSDFKDVIAVDKSGLVLSQRIEPEQGRASISTINLALIDKGGFITQVLSSGGGIVSEAMGLGVTLYLGYQELSYPNDFFRVFRGFISDIAYTAGAWMVQISDANAKRKKNVFFSATVQLSANISNSATTIPLTSSADFPIQIQNALGAYDPAVKTYIKIDDEFIQFPPGAISGASLIGVTRAARGTTAATHQVGADVAIYTEIADHGVDMALKLMLSGWNGPWKTGQPVKSFCYSYDATYGNPSNALILPDNVDANRDLGLVVGDFITVTGSPNVGNNIANLKIIDIQDINTSATGQAVLVSHSDGTPVTFTPESATNAVLALRSQFDAYPLNTCGMKLTPLEVDVQGHLDVKELFLSDPENSLRFLLSTQEMGKSFIESQIYLPLALYSLTRRGRLSCKLTKPPVASAGTIVLNQTNLIEPEKITVKRSTNDRTFFNEIVMSFDEDDAGNFAKIYHYVDTDSYNDIGLLSTLPLDCRGVRSDLSSNVSKLLQRRAFFLLSRYKRCAVIVRCTTMWGPGSQIEGGDVVILDGTGLSLPNDTDGSRALPPRLYEIVDRQLDQKTGRAALMLVAGVGAEATDRFAVISPSSVIASVPASTQIKIQDSFTSSSPVYPLNEPKKWANFVGQKIAIHDEGYTRYGECTLKSFDLFDHYKINISSDLGFTPQAGDIVDIPRYPTSPDQTVNSIYKAIYAYQGPQLTVTGGSSSTQFTVSSADAAKCPSGAFPVRVHDAAYTQDSSSSGVDVMASISGTTITAQKSLGFTPTAGMLVDLVGFLDKGGPYRFL
jgi:hypothetical protein